LAAKKQACGEKPGPCTLQKIRQYRYGHHQILVLDTALNDLRDNAIWHTGVTLIAPPAGLGTGGLWR